MVKEGRGQECQLAVVSSQAFYGKAASEEPRYVVAAAWRQEAQAVCSWAWHWYIFCSLLRQLKYVATKPSSV